MVEPTAETAHYEYAVFGRPVRSAVRLPKLRPRERVGEPPFGPEIRVRRADLPAAPETLSASVKVYEDPEGVFTVYETDGGTYYWFYDGVGTLRVRDGREIALSRAPDASEVACRNFLRGPGLRSVLVQRGAVVLHASAVVVDGQAVAFAGPSGQGKSTAAGACVAAGHDLLTDDVLPSSPSEGATTVPPGYPSLSLDARGADELGFDRDGDGVAVGDRFAETPAPLAAVYLLTDGDAVDIERLATQRAVFALMEASYALYTETDWDSQHRHLDACGRLAADVDVCRLTRPRSFSKLDDLVAAVEADVACR